MENGKNIDFYNTHLSLSAEARKRSLLYFTDFIFNEGGQLSKVFGGDFNAEAHEPALLHLLSSTNKIEKVELETEIDGTLTNGDLWSEPFYPIKFFDFSTKKENTFPVNDAVKRIDFLLGKNMSDSKLIPINRSVEIIGIHAYEMLYHEDNVEEELDNIQKELLNVRSKVGVFERNALLWASDHFGIICELNVTGGEIFSYSFVNTPQYQEQRDEST